MFSHDEKLRLKICSKVYIECTKNNQTLTLHISSFQYACILREKFASVSAVFKLTLVRCTWVRDFLKNNSFDYDIKWSIASKKYGHANPLSCKLCLMEKYWIIKYFHDPSLLNKKTGTDKLVQTSE